MDDPVLVIGEALVDIVLAPDGTHAEHPGGSPANVALGLARLGRPTQLLTRIGADARGELIIRHQQAAGVTVLPGSVTEQATSTATARLDANGAATYTFDLRWELAGAALSDAAALHTGSIATYVQPGATAVLNLLDQAAGRMTVTYDPNVRPALMGSAAQGLRQVEAVVARADVVKVSDEDLAWLTPDQRPDDVAAHWLDLGASVVVVTRGGAGAFALCRAGRVDVAAPKVSVIDTVGAGDSFMSGVIDHLYGAELLGSAAATALRSASREQIEAMVGHAVRISAFTCTRAGADPPTRAELRAWNAELTN